MELLWTDETSYSRSEKREERIPRIWTTLINGFKLSIHRCRDYGNIWLLTAHDLGIGQHDLKTNNLEEAEQKAITNLIERLKEFVSAHETLIKLQ